MNRREVRANQSFGAIRTGHSLGAAIATLYVLDNALTSSKAGTKHLAHLIHDGRDFGLASVAEGVDVA